MSSDNRVVLIGIPFDENSSFLKGTAEAPPKIREALHSYSTNMCAENGIDLSRNKKWRDEGDLKFDETKDAFSLIEKSIGDLLNTETKVLTLGGDHSITYPIIRSYSKKYDNLNILHFDAHPDLYDNLEGNKLSHACPMARIMEGGHATRLVQVGIRTMNPNQQQQAERFGVEVYHMKNCDGNMRFDFNGPVYITLDLDVLDPAFAPGVSHHEPGGMQTRDVLSIIQNLNAEIVGADIVEYNPLRDVNGVTAMVAAKFLKEILVKMI